MGSVSLEVFTVATLRSVGAVAGLFVWVAGSTASATECCVLNPNLKLHFESESCGVENNVFKCAAIEKVTGNKPALLSFLDDEVPGEPFPPDAFIYVCPINPAEGPIPTANRSFVKDKNGVIADVTQNLKFIVYFDQQIFQGTVNTVTDAEKSKDEFPMEFQINGTTGGTTDIRLVGLGHATVNAKAVADDDTQKVSANVSGNVVGDPGNNNQFRGEPVLVEGRPVCTTNQTFDHE